MIDKKTMEMLESSDDEMVKLGVVLLFNKGEKWIEKNVPSFGTTVKELHMIKTSCCSGIRLRRGNIGFWIRGKIDARYLNQFVSKESEFEEI